MTDQALAETTDRNTLERHLVVSRLAGSVNTSPGNTLRNCRKLVDGDPEYTFGLPDWRDATHEEAVDSIRLLCGGDPVTADPHGPGWIEPRAALDAIERHRRGLAAFAGGGGGRVLLATGHPTGLLSHYVALARALQDRGSALLAPLDDTRWDVPWDGGRRWGVRFLDGVGCVFDGASLRHTHLSMFMEAMLDELGGGPDGVDLVIGDHGMAGAAVARGIPALSIADVNDPALPLAQARGRTDGVLPIDDNLAPQVFVPVTQAMLAWR